MIDQTTSARIRTTIEDELAEIAPLSHLSTEMIEDIAQRLTRAIEPVLAGAASDRESRAA